MEEEIVNKGYLDNLGLVELMVLPFYIFIVFTIAYAHQRKNIGFNPSYTYFARGVLAKLVGGTVFCLIYVYYYKGGDTFSYFESARSFCLLLKNHPYSFWDAFTGSNSMDNYFLFDNTTGYPLGNIYFENRGFFMIHMVVPFVLLGFNSYLISSLLLSVASFVGIWRMYQVLVRYYPSLYRPLALGFIFLPTAIFWGSGILKDTFTLSGFCWFVSSIEMVFISKKKIFRNAIIAFVSGCIVLFIKPYIIMACIPGLIVWLFHERVRKIKNNLWRNLSLPFIFMMSLAIGASIMSFLGDKLDKFALTKVLDTASVAQRDLKDESYHGNSFDIGNYDASLAGITSKFPVATIAGLFRPFVWEAKNFVMVLSGLENLILLYLFLYPIYKIGPRKIMRILFNQPLLLFLFTYSILFAFSIGISTSNFGALIRFKIAFAPFMVAMLLVLYNNKKLHLHLPRIPQQKTKKHF
ncbi:MAG TPA: hypothetical protein VGO45_11955 [Bacteroidia bacterium]|nr:hypothetical protein [Bacteroidia bacterium]